MSLSIRHAVVTLVIQVERMVPMSDHQAQDEQHNADSMLHGCQLNTGQFVSYAPSKEMLLISVSGRVDACRRVSYASTI